MPLLPGTKVTKALPLAPSAFEGERIRRPAGATAAGPADAEPIVSIVDDDISGQEWDKTVLLSVGLYAVTFRGASR